jgi:hypothetical protein
MDLRWTPSCTWPWQLSRRPGRQRAGIGAPEESAMAPDGTVPPPAKAIPRKPAESSCATDHVGQCVDQTVRPPVTLASGLERTAGHRDPKASGSACRSSGSDSVRHMSVTTSIQGRTAGHPDTRWDKSKAAREPGYAQARGRFRWWWQVFGSNQRRLSRRLYRTPIPAHRNGH